MNRFAIIEQDNPQVFSCFCRLIGFIPSQVSQQLILSNPL
jgi:hypothetical protein